MGSNKSPGTAGITKKFDETFWKERAMKRVQTAITANVNETFQIGDLSVSQENVII